MRTRWRSGLWGAFTATAVPKVRRDRVPHALMTHLVERIREREIGTDQLKLLAQWLDGEPEVPEGQWFKRFPGMILCGEGELVKTFLRLGQVPAGQEVS
jgi:hypothetical protein